ncbi:chloride channel voltage gated [Lucifera butyrica]|uniref:Chloride channel voltage gated n=1 Tax=Lucifera butyrica TaxID=1351585 RepID=A0A498R387_9FIRM|nr:ClC family H(+)/Cl(-) exchange transporter [Lucifera butyrica]VBB05250.1 chloride channel voltage gated [Lucifera butyrica]
MTRPEASKVYHALLHWRDFRFKIFLEGIFIGLIAGITVVLFRYILELAEKMRNALYVHLHTGPWSLTLLWFLSLLFIAYLLGKIVAYEPMSGGSGIPQVKAVILRLMKMNWQRIIASKFVGGVLAIGAGLSLGREGPSIQLGAAIGQGLSRLMGRTKMEERYLLTSGASAGLAAAFSAPLAGVIFSLEELHKNFSPAVLMSAMAASLTAALVTQSFFGANPIFSFTGIPVFPFRYYGYLVILGIVTGLLGVLFNRVLIGTLNFYDRQRVLPKGMQAAIPLLLGGLAGFVLPEILGGGNDLVNVISSGRFTLDFMLILIAAKFIFTMISYGSGVPGGIFLPLLVVGALTGGISGTVAVHYLGVDPFYYNNFIVLAMAAFFTAVVKAPITGSILILEMTGSFTHLLSLIAVSMTAYLTTDIVKSKPVYDELMERSLAKSGSEPASMGPRNRMVTELVVCVGSKLDGQKIKNISWPSHCLLVSIRRGEMEIIPKGDTKIIAGDYLYVLTNEGQTEEVYELAGECIL